MAPPERQIMKRVFALAAILLPLATAAEASDGQVLRGLFCNTRAQLEATLRIAGGSNELATAVAMTNRDQVVCTFAHSIAFMVINPVAIGTGAVNGNRQTLYEATLMGVLVGSNPRPVDPPLRIFFVSMDPVSASATEKGA
jgi:hypothetical protein